MTEFQERIRGEISYMLIGRDITEIDNCMDEIEDLINREIKKAVYEVKGFRVYGVVTTNNTMVLKERGIE